MTFEELKAEALKLSHEERGKLARSLIFSLDGLDDEAEPDPEIERLWVEEAERRYQDWVAGKVQAIPLEEAIREIRKSLR